MILPPGMFRIETSDHAVMYSDGRMFYVGPIDEPGTYQFAATDKKAADRFMDVVEKFVVDQRGE